MTMRAYDGYENLDEYETDGDEYEEDDAGEEEYEEEESHQPTGEELEYLALRQRLKEDYRKRMKKESGSGHASSVSKKNLSTNFGSFFGPSQPVIAQRVIQESKSLLENPDIAARNFKSSTLVKHKSSSSTPVGSKPRPSSSAPKVVTNGVKRKAEMLKTTRDYSFLLSDDAELPAPAKDSRPRNVSAPNSDARYAKMQERSREPLSNGARRVPDGRDERKLKPSAHQAQGKLGSQKPATGSKPNQTSIDAKKRLPSNNGTNHGRPLMDRVGPSKIPVGSLQKKVCAPGARSAVLHKPAPTKLHPSVSKQPLVQKREMQESHKAKVLQKQPTSSSKPQIKAPPRNPSRVEDDRRVPLRNSSRTEDERRAPQRNSSRTEDERRAPQKNSSRMEDEHTKRKPIRRDEPRRRQNDDDDAISEIRKMFGYNPSKYHDDDDVSDMEANFHDILREEKRSSKIAKEEDERALREIEEEERRQRLRKEAKRRKLSQQ